MKTNKDHFKIETYFFITALNAHTRYLDQKVYMKIPIKKKMLIFIVLSDYFEV